MNIEEIVEYINRLTTPRLLRFVSEKGENSCRECLKYHDQIFEENDKNMPHIPLHPNCRCKYEYLTNSEVTELQNKVLNAKEELITYGNKIADFARQLLAICSNEAKNHSIQNVAELIVITIPLAWKIDKAIQATNRAVNTVDNIAENTKILAAIITLKLTLSAMQKINQIAELTEQEMKKLGIPDMAKEIRSWANIHDELISELKTWHYARLSFPEQRLENLPKKPAEAVKQGFVKASSFENMYHRHKNQKGNVKYTNKQTGQEIVFNEKGQVVTDPENIGTFNYASSDNKLEHFWYDMILYYLFGNSEDDTTPVVNRIFSHPALWYELILEKINE